MNNPSSITRMLSKAGHRLLDGCWYAYGVWLAPVKRANDAAASAMQVASLKSELGACGERVAIQCPVTITHKHCVKVGSDVALAAYVHIWGSGGVSIGNHVMIGTHTSISSVTHDYKKDVMYGTILEEQVTIHDNVWIGSNCVILPGVTIQSGAVVGAGAVVTRDVPPYAVVVGVPARILTMRPQAARATGATFEAHRL